MCTTINYRQTTYHTYVHTTENHNCITYVTLLYTMHVSFFLTTTILLYACSLAIFALNNLATTTFRSLRIIMELCNSILNSGNTVEIMKRNSATVYGSAS